MNSWGVCVFIKLRHLATTLKSPNFAGLVCKWAIEQNYGSFPQEHVFNREENNKRGEICYSNAEVILVEESWDCENENDGQDVANGKSVGVCVCVSGRECEEKE